MEALIVGYHFINALEEQENEMQVPRPARMFLRRENAFNLSDAKFNKLFRLNKRLTHQLIQMVCPYIVPASRKSAISVETKVLVALNFYGHGSYQTITGSSIFTAVSQAMACRCIK